jgi:nucleoid-associated protein YgaU
MSITPEMLQAQRSALRPTAGVPLAPPPPQLPVGNAKLGPAESTAAADYVEFDFNPATITISHTAPVVPSAGLRPTSGAAAEGSGVELSAKDVDELEKAKGTTTIALRALTFDGEAVSRTCLRLLDWTHFAAVTDKASAKRTELPRLKFIWGTRQVYLVHLNQVTVTYTRFSRTGIPVRATVDLTLHSIPKVPGPTNPSSGGLAGRRSHLLTGAESLPELATRCYGGPGRWREIAAANGFEDPLRVRPGTRVYLPGTQEAGR